MGDSDLTKPRVNLRFLFLMCNDVQEVKDFYEGLLGMQVQSFMNDEAFGWLCLQCEGFQMMFFRVDNPFTPVQKFAQQPGWPGGDIETTSWGIEIPEESFRETFEKLRDAEKVKTFFEVPQWLQDSYWGFPVLDPAGNTIEVFTYVKERPENTAWS